MLLRDPVSGNLYHIMVVHHTESMAMVAAGAYQRFVGVEVADPFSLCVHCEDLCDSVRISESEADRVRKWSMCCLYLGFPAVELDGGGAFLFG